MSGRRSPFWPPPLAGRDDATKGARFSSGGSMIARDVPRFGIIAAIAGTIVVGGCHSSGSPSALSRAVDPLDTLADHALRYAQIQLQRTADSLDPAEGYPKSTKPDGGWNRVRATDWTSGFFAGELWRMYEATRDPYWRTQAMRWTSGLESSKTLTTTHDLGFIIFTSFGNEYRLTGNEHARQVILDAAAHLAGRFNPAVGATKSWDTENARGRRGTWEYPVIVDNLMNLELLFWASRHGGDSAWKRMAERHALTSLDAHVRDDGSTAHVALFDPRTGRLIDRVTWQGYADTSVW